MNNSCATALPYDRLIVSLGIKFVTGELRSHLCNIWYEAEVARFPETLPWAKIQQLWDAAEVRYKQFELFFQLRVLTKTDEASALVFRQAALHFAKEMELPVADDHDNVPTHKIYEQIRDSRKRGDITEQWLKACKPYVFELVQAVTEDKRQAVWNRLARMGIYPTDYTDDDFVENQPIRKGHCASNGCIGLLDHGSACVTCKHFTCTACATLLGNASPSTHTCDPAQKAAVKMMLKTSKPCPSCGVGIEKVSGCNMMWCTQCQTTFDWTTGDRIITRNIHNPHYIEFLRTRRLNAVGDRAGCDMVHFIELVGRCNLRPESKMTMLRMGRRLYEFHDYWQTQFHADTIAEKKLSARIQYMVNGDKKKFMATITHLQT
jgi:hypothetical protein